MRDVDLKIEIGWLGPGNGDFMRVVHLPTGKSVTAGPRRSEPTKQVEARLRRELQELLRSEGLDDGSEPNR